jgi:hypothetical protein
MQAAKVRLAYRHERLCYAHANRPTAAFDKKPLPPECTNPSFMSKKNVVARMIYDHRDDLDFHLAFLTLVRDRIGVLSALERRSEDEEDELDFARQFMATAVRSCIDQMRVANRVFMLQDEVDLLKLQNSQLDTTADRQTLVQNLALIAEKQAAIAELREKMQPSKVALARQYALPLAAVGTAVAVSFMAPGMLQAAAGVLSTTVPAVGKPAQQEDDLHH